MKFSHDMKCIHCGMVLSDGANFCTECGRAQNQERGVLQSEKRQTQVNGASALTRNIQPAMVPLVEGKVYKLGSSDYEAAFDASANRWQLEDLINYQRDLILEDDGSFTETRYDPNLLAYKAIGPSGFTLADINHTPMRANATAYWFVLVTFITIAALAVVNALLNISFMTDRDLLDLLQAGFAGNPIDEVWATEIMDVRRTLMISLSESIASAIFVTYLITILSFLTWFYRAYKNLEFGGFSLKYNPWWTVGGFMVPILNLLRPFRMMQELSSASIALSEGEKPGTKNKIATSPMVKWWWVLFLAIIQPRIVQDRLFGEIDQFDEFLKALWFSLAGDLLLIAAAIVTLLLVRQIHTLQKDARTKHQFLGQTLAYTQQTHHS